MVCMVAAEREEDGKESARKELRELELKARNRDTGSQSYCAATVPYGNEGAPHWRFCFFSNIGKGPPLCFASSVSSKPLGSFCGLEVPGEVGH